MSCAREPFPAAPLGAPSTRCLSTPPTTARRLWPVFKWESRVQLFAKSWTTPVGDDAKNLCGAFVWITWVVASPGMTTVRFLRLTQRKNYLDVCEKLTWFTGCPEEGVNHHKVPGYRNKLTVGELIKLVVDIYYVTGR